MPIRFANNATTVLLSALTAEDTTVLVRDASRFPVLGADDFCLVTILTMDGQSMEIIKVTSIAQNTLVAERGQDGTEAQVFDAGVLVDLRMPAGAIEELRNEPGPADAVTADKISKLEGAVKVLSNTLLGSNASDMPGTVYTQQQIEENAMNADPLSDAEGDDFLTGLNAGFNSVR